MIRVFVVVIKGDILEIVDLSWSLGVLNFGVFLCGIGCVG